MCTGLLYRCALSSLAFGIVTVWGTGPVEGQSPARVTVQKGGSFSVTLPISAGTNYEWVPTQLDGQILVYRGKRGPLQPAKKPGGVEEYVYSFEARQVGTTTLEMGLVPRTGKKVPAKISRIDVAITR